MCVQPFLNCFFSWVGCWKTHWYSYIVTNKHAETGIIHITHTHTHMHTHRYTDRQSHTQANMHRQTNKERVTKSGIQIDRH